MYVYDWKKLGLNEGSTTPIQTIEFFFSEFTEWLVIIDNKQFFVFVYVVLDNLKM